MVAGTGGVGSGDGTCSRGSERVRAGVPKEAVGKPKLENSAGVIMNGARWEALENARG